MALVDLSAIDRLLARLAKVGDDLWVDASGLMVSLMKIIDDDNREGVLAGLDKDGVPMAPVTYRPKPTLTILRPTKAQENTTNARARRGAMAGFGPAAAGLHNNLTSREYGRLAGPPLAPRGAFSRVVSNLATGYQRLDLARWEAYGYWHDVVSTGGVPFLHAHFTGAATGRDHRVGLPRRDLRGVRPDGRAEAAKAARNWALDVLRRSG